MCFVLADMQTDEDGTTNTAFTQPKTGKRTGMKRWTLPPQNDADDGCKTGMFDHLSVRVHSPGSSM